MTPTDFLDQLLAHPDSQQQRAWLKPRSDALTLEDFAAFKARSDALALEHPQRALETAEAALLAAAMTKLPLAAAIAHWARGNAWLCLSDYQRAFSDYEQACDLYRARDNETYRLEIARLQTNMIEALKNLGRYETALALAETAHQTLQPWAESRYTATLAMNVGSLNRMLGRYESALAAYERGRATFLALDDPVQVARIDINRARVLGMMDRFTEAETLLQRTREKLTELGKQLPAARAILNLATYRQARADFATLDNQTDVAVTDLYRTYDYLALNLWPEAMETAAQARETLEQQAMPRYVALATGNWAAAACRMGHYDEALDALLEARAFFAAHGAQREVAKLDLERVICLREMGNLEEALTVAENTVAILAQSPLPLRTAQAQLALADVLLAMDANVQTAAAHYTQALEATRDFPALHWHAYAGLGRVAAAQGQTQAAYDHYRQAIACLETVEAELGVTALQAGFLADKMDVYRQAIAVALALKAEDTAFELAQRAKTGVWRAFLAPPDQQVPPQAQEAPETLASLRDTWHWLYQRLTRADVEEDASPPLDPQRGRAQAQWAALKAVEHQIAAHQRAQPAASTEVSPPSLSRVQARLPEGVVLLDYVWMQDAIAVFVVNHQEVHVLPAVATSPTITRLLNRWRFNLESVRLALSVHRASPDRGAGLRSETSPNQAYAVRPRSPDLGVRLADEAHDILRDLYHHLIAPVVPYLEGQTALWIVPHDTLWEVPFAALHDGNQYLVERFTLMNVPGLLPHEAAQGQRHSPAAIAAAPVVVGYSDGGRLTYALHEAETVAALWDRATVLLEEESTVADVQEAASACTLLHLATHGIFRQDAPLFSALHLTDGALTAHDLEAWRMPAVELVTLSACETGMHVSWGSDLLGLARGFWRAGAPRLLVSLWAVDDVSTADLMAHVYTALQAGDPVAAALQAAQTNALVKYRHPFYWAGFTLLVLTI